MSYRDDLTAIYHAALAAVGGRPCVRRALRDFDADAPLYVVAVGKAASAMCQGAYDVQAGNIVAALVITRQGHGDAALVRQGVTLIESGHPWPTQASLDAGEKLLDFIRAVPARGRLLFLISGGASSLVEVLPKGVSLRQLREVNQWLLGSGLDIHAMNQVRKALSLIKGGRLARYLNGRQTDVLLISDVPGDDAAVVGSGLLVAGRLPGAPPTLPSWINVLMAKGEAAPQTSDGAFDAIRLRIIATLAHARRAAADKGAELGYPVHEHPGLVSGDAVAAGRRLVTQLLEGAAGLHVWGGETTVLLPERPGRGGRNQHLALAAAIELQGRDGLALLAAGTDGSDGPTAEAGALVDGGSLNRGKRLGLDAGGCLLACDSGTFLAASGDLIQTGPTGTNVMDLMLGLRVSLCHHAFT